MKSYLFLFCFIGAIFFSSCQSKEKKNSESLPGRVKVQSILIGFKGSLPGKDLERSKEEAQKLAREVFEKSKKKGEDFGNLVVSYSDDMIPGIFELIQDSKNQKTDQFLKSEFFKAWADKAFDLQVGEVAYVPYEENQEEETQAAYGFYILKRLE